jgi:curved DNA-binding protein CbpA
MAERDSGNNQGLPPRDPKWQRQPNLTPGVTDPYVVLGLESSASQDEIRERYFMLVREHPPEQDAGAFKIIRTAYEKLRTEGAQAETNLFLLKPPPPWESAGELSDPDLDLHLEDVLTALRGWVGRDEPDISGDFREVRPYEP